MQVGGIWYNGILVLKDAVRMCEMLSASVSITVLFSGITGLAAPISSPVTEMVEPDV